MRCFSRSGWWQTLCGLDSANQIYGWTDKRKHVQCDKCKALIAKGFDKDFASEHILVELRKCQIYKVELRHLWAESKP